MGTDAADAETLPYPYSYKIHRSMAIELRKLVDRIAKIFPEIEEARPRCSNGIEALCMLNSAIEKAKQLLQQCCESSKLYLAVTGEAILLRCQKVRKSLEQSLGQIQTMVPKTLATEISLIIDDLRAAMFRLDSPEEEAGKAMRDLLRQGASESDSLESSEIKAFQLASSKLHISSPKAILLEERSIKGLLRKVGDNDPPKKNILMYFLRLLKKYRNVIMEEKIENPSAQHEGSFVLMNSSNSSEYSQSVEVDFHIQSEEHVDQTDVVSRATPPEAFKCPLSKRLMSDPVVIASGETFERMQIQKWFDDGNDTCPITKVKLAHFLLTPNTVMKDLILKWCEKYGITVPNQSMEAFQSLDTSSISIASLGSYVNDLHLPLDISNISLGSLDSSYTSDSSSTKVAERSSLMLTQKNDSSHRCQSLANISETDLKFLSSLAELDKETQCKVVEDVKNQLQYNDQVCHSISSENFVEPLIPFLRDALDQHDVRAQRSGSQLMLVFVSKSRSGISFLHQDMFNLLASYLESEVIGEVLAMLEVLSGYPYCISKIATSGALVSILNILDSHSEEFQEQALKILQNVSSNNDICSQLVSLECIPKMVTFINDSNLSRHCMVLLKNLCKTEEGRVSVAETSGCIASISELLERGSSEDQEHAVAVLLSLCSQRVQYCQLVMDEGILLIPSLVHVSVNGSEKGRMSALELLRQLREFEYPDDKEALGPDLAAGKDDNHHSTENKSSPRRPGFFSNLSIFSRHRSHAKKKR